MIAIKEIDLCTADRIVAQAKKWVGYCGKPTNANLDEFLSAEIGNYNRFARDYAISIEEDPDAFHMLPWNGMFIADMFIYEFGIEKAKELLGGRPYCQNGLSLNYFKHKGMVRYSDPAPGDLVYFYTQNRHSFSHCGIVVYVTDYNFFTIEGDTTTENGVARRGNQVAQKKYPLTYSMVAGYVTPEYDAPADKFTDLYRAWLDEYIGQKMLTGELIPDSIRALQMYATNYYECDITGVIDEKTIAVMKNPKLKPRRNYFCPINYIVQYMLFYHGYNPKAIDGHFTVETLNAVKQFQRENGLMPNGEVGVLTWKKLLSKC